MDHKSFCNDVLMNECPAVFHKGPGSEVLRFRTRFQYLDRHTCGLRAVGGAVEHVQVFKCVWFCVYSQHVHLQRVELTGDDQRMERAAEVTRHQLL